MPRINISRRLAIINGFVEIPNGDEGDKNKVTVDEALSLIPGSTTIRESISGRKYFVLPAYESMDGPAEDYFGELEDEAASQ